VDVMGILCLLSTKRAGLMDRADKIHYLSTKSGISVDTKDKLCLLSGSALRLWDSWGRYDIC